MHPSGQVLPSFEIFESFREFPFVKSVGDENASGMEEAVAEEFVPCNRVIAYICLVREFSSLFPPGRQESPENIREISPPLLGDYGGYKLSGSSIISWLIALKIWGLFRPEFFQNGFDSVNRYRKSSAHGDLWFSIIYAGTDLEINSPKEITIPGSRIPGHRVQGVRICGGRA